MVMTAALDLAFGKISLYFVAPARPQIDVENVEEIKPHPVLAPLAWLLCLSLGLGFWALLVYLIL
jgi:hypothetical protein